MVIYYETEGLSTCPASKVDELLLKLEANPFEDKIETSSEILVHRAYELYRERKIREFVLVSGNKSYIADPDRIMRQWPPGCPPEVMTLEKVS